jgi:hypothetical protein
VRLRPVGLARALPTCLFQNAGPESEVLQWRPHGNLFRCRAASPWWFGNWRWRVRPFWGRAARRRLCLVPNFGLWQLTVAGPGNRGCCQSKLPAARRQSGVRVPNNSHQTRSPPEALTNNKQHKPASSGDIIVHQERLASHSINRTSATTWSWLNILRAQALQALQALQAPGISAAVMGRPIING